MYRSYKSTFGLIAGVTEAIETFTEEMAALGERFLRYWMKIDKSLEGRIEYNRRAQMNARHKNTMRKELNDVAKQCLKKNFTEELTINDQILNKILHLAEFIARCRGTVRRERYTNEITHKPFTELSTRLSTQLTKLLHGIMYFRGIQIATDNEYKILKKIALGSTSGRYIDIVKNMYNNNEKLFSPSDFSEYTELSNIMTQRLAENLVMLNVLKRANKTILRPQYTISDEMSQIIEVTEIFQKK